MPPAKKSWFRTQKLRFNSSTSMLFCLFYSSELQTQVRILIDRHWPILMLRVWQLRCSRNDDYLLSVISCLNTFRNTRLPYSRPSPPCHSLPQCFPVPLSLRQTFVVHSASSKNILLRVERLLSKVLNLPKILDGKNKRVTEGIGKILSIEWSSESIAKSYYAKLIHSQIGL